MNNIRVVDDIVRETEQLLSGFYGDQETSYIFTADHGMSKIGNHGDGGNYSPLITSIPRSPPAPQILTTHVPPLLRGAPVFVAQSATLPSLNHWTTIRRRGSSRTSCGVM